MGRIVGLLVVCIGVLIVLLKSGIIKVAAIWLTAPVLWPLLLVLLGFIELMKPGRLKQRRKIPWGSWFFVVYGLLLSLQGTEYLHWLSDLGFWSLTTALIIIFIGLALCFPKSGSFFTVTVTSQKPSKWKWSNTNENNVSDDMTDSLTVGPASQFIKEPKWSWLIVGDLSIGRTPWVLHDMRLFNGIGDIRVNLATAHVEDGTYHLDITGWIGDVRILVPEDVPVRIVADLSVGSISIFGEQNDGIKRSVHHEDPAYATALRRCDVQIGLRIGDVEVVRV